MALTITLPQHIQSYIRRQVDEGRFDSAEAVIAAAVEQVMDEYRWDDDADLLEAIAEVDRGGAVPWAPELRMRILRESEESALRGDPVPENLTL